MKQPRSSHGAYVRKVQEGAQSFAHDVIAEVERLQVLVAALGAEKESLSEKVEQARELAKANEALRALAASLEAEMNRLQEQAIAQRAENERHQKEHSRLSAQLAIIRAESQGFSARYSEIEQQHGNLANLYVASYRLHGTLDRKEVIDAIQEIIANLIGSEEFCLFEVDAKSGALELAASFGVAVESARALPARCEPIGQAVKSGEPFVADTPPRQGRELADRLTACIPLTLDGRVTGAIAIFQLLPQKAGIEDVDRELFELLATHAATALYCASLHARLGAPTAAC